MRTFIRHGHVNDVCSTVAMSVSIINRPNGRVIKFIYYCIMHLFTVSLYANIEWGSGNGHAMCSV